MEFGSLQRHTRHMLEGGNHGEGNRNHWSFERLWPYLSANALAKAGHTVYALDCGTPLAATCRKVEDVRKFAHDNKVELRPIELDVSSEESIEVAIRQIVAEQGRLDVLVHNAGHMVFRTPRKRSRRSKLAELYDINVLSTQRVKSRVALPQMRKTASGGSSSGVSSSSSAGGTPPVSFAILCLGRRAWTQWRSSMRAN